MGMLPVSSPLCVTDVQAVKHAWVEGHISDLTCAYQVWGVKPGSLSLHGGHGAISAGLQRKCVYFSCGIACMCELILANASDACIVNA